MDIGYGNGYLLKYLYKKTKSDLYGIDISADMLKQANEKGTIENKEIMLKYDVSYIEVCAIDRMLQIMQMEKETLNNFSKQSI